MTGTAWQRLCGLSAFRVTQIPRRLDDTGDPGLSQRTAVLVSAYHAAQSAAGAPGTIAVGWVRATPGGPVHLLVAGPALRGSASLAAPGTALALPSGGRGQPVPAGGMGGALTAVSRRARNPRTAG